MKYHLLVWVILGFVLPINAQNEASIFEYKSIDIQVNFGLQQPIGQLNDRYGNNSIFGGKLDYKWPKTNISIGIEGSYMFGSKVKEDVLSPLYGADSFVYGADGLPAVVFLRERGYYLGAHIAKLWKLGGTKNLTGIKTSLGFGFLSHSIRVLDDTRSTLQFIEPYGNGYDRLTYGFSMRQDIGYQFFSANNRINFYFGIHVVEALTKNRRTWNFIPNDPIESKLGWDVLLGAEIGWIVPIYFGKGNKDNLIYY